jgi:prepilin-type processing-associated H-X9-DG protein
MLMPAVSIVRSMATSSRCMSHLRQQAVAFMAYSSDYEGYLPAPMTYGVSAMVAGWNSNLSVNYGTGKPIVVATDTDQTSGDGIFVEPLYCRKEAYSIVSYRYLTGYGMHLYLPPNTLTPKTDWNVAQGTNPILPRIAEPGSTILAADTTNCAYLPERGCTHSLEATNTMWHFQNLFGYVHRTKANLLFVDGHVELLSITQAYAGMTTTKAFIGSKTW